MSAKKKPETIDINGYTITIDKHGNIRDGIDRGHPMILRAAHVDAIGVVMALRKQVPLVSEQGHDIRIMNGMLEIGCQQFTAAEVAKYVRLSQLARRKKTKS